MKKLLIIMLLSFNNVHAAEFSEEVESYCHNMVGISATIADYARDGKSYSAIIQIYSSTDMYWSSLYMYRAVEIGYEIGHAGKDFGHVVEAIMADCPIYMKNYIGNDLSVQ